METLIPRDKHGHEILVGDLLAHEADDGFTMFRVGQLEPPIWPEECCVLLKTETEWKHSIMTKLGVVSGWEIVARGSPNDPVPDRFEPERDADGRPVLGIEIDRLDRCSYCWMGLRIVDAHVATDLIGQYHADCVSKARQARDGYRVPGSFTQRVFDALARFHRWAYAEAICARALANVGSVRDRKLRLEDFNPATATGGSKPLEKTTAPIVLTGDVEIDQRRALRLPDPTTLKQRYDAFRATVERVVREEAPRASWTTDNVVKNSAPHYVVWLSLDGIVHEALCPDSGVAAFVRGMCKGLRDKIGARAMGKVDK